MSNKALDLLIECELLKLNGDMINIHKVPSSELSHRFSTYVNSRREIIYSEVDDHPVGSKLSAQFSTWSSRFSKQNTLSSLLVYDKLVLNDPLITSDSGISIDNLRKGLEFYSWLYPLIRNGFVTVYPIDFYDKPSKDIPLWITDDAFKSSISPQIHDFAHKNAILKSVVEGDNGDMLILSENANIKRRTALNVGFKDDQLFHGVGLFRHEIMINVKKREDGTLTYENHWDPKGVLPEDRFDQWAYQATNQAIIARLKAIYNQTFLAQKLGHTYITESEFESNLLSFSNAKNAESISPCVRFLNFNEKFINIESPQTIIKLRDKYPRAFDRFNSSLISVSEELHGVSPDSFDKKCQSLLHKEILPQVDEVRSAIGQISSGFISGALSSLAVMGLAIATGPAVPLIPALLLSTVHGLSGTIQPLRNLQNMKHRPAYIWHKLVKK